MNYFALAAFAFGAAPSWIANLGVVPLFLLAAFLLAPIALCLALRRFSVTAVLEAINISSRNKSYFLKMKLLNLTVWACLVKVFLFSSNAAFSQISPSDMILAKGEQREIKILGVQNFSVGNPDVISYRLRAKAGKLLIKGKKVGFTDLVIWGKKGKKTFSIYVLSKQKFLKTIQLADTLKNLNLKIDIKGPMMTASGEINDFSDYLYLQKIKNQFQEHVFFKIELSRQLKSHIIGHIYKKLFSNGFSSVSCQTEWLDILCFYEGQKNAELLKNLNQYYKVSFIQQDSIQNHKNYRLKLKLLQLERLDGQEIHLGLDKLQSSVKQIFDQGLRSLIDSNLIYLQSTQSDLSTLAEPEMIVNLNNPQLIEIGSQIPYQNISTQGATVLAPIDWRFAGLKIKTKVTELYGKFSLEYETEFSRPDERAISGTKEISSAFLKLGEPIKIFQVGFQTSGQDKKGIPLLNQVPILKNLFQSKSKIKTYKQIYGYVILEEEP